MINLLPNSAKKKYGTELIWRLTLFYTVVLFIVLFIFIGLLMSINAYLRIVQAAENDSIGVFEQTSQYSGLQASESKVKDINVQIQRALTLNNRIIRISQLFPEIYAQIPSGIFLNNLSFDVSGQKLFINGFSLSRNDILNFKKNLEGLKWVKKVDSPTSNILHENNSPFDFNIVTDIKPQ